MLVGRVILVYGRNGVGGGGDRTGEHCIMNVYCLSWFLFIDLFFNFFFLGMYTYSYKNNLNPLLQHKMSHPSPHPTPRTCIEEAFQVRAFKSLI